MLTKDKVFVVTGGGNGIGREVVLELLRRGARVAAADLSADALAETARLASAGERLTTHTLNVTDVDAVGALPAAVIAAHGQVDAVVNVAGIIQPFVRVVDLDPAVMHRVMDVNFWGVVNVVKAFLPGLLERPSGHICNVASMGAYAPVPGQTLYGASKAAVKQFSEGLHAELLDTRVHVTVVFPGATATDITGHSGVAVEGASAESSSFKMLSPEEAARLIVEGIEKNRLHVFTGSDAKFLDRLARIAPDHVGKFLYRQMKSLLS